MHHCSHLCSNAKFIFNRYRVISLLTLWLVGRVCPTKISKTKTWTKIAQKLLVTYSSGRKSICSCFSLLLNLLYSKYIYDFFEKRGEFPERYLFQEEHCIRAGDFSRDPNPHLRYIWRNLAQRLIRQTRAG